VLTGFKFFGEKIKLWESTGEYTYVFGFEESFGYLGGTHARDKDAVSASMLFAEMICYYKYVGVSALDRLEKIYQTYGYYKDYSNSVMYKGLDGMQQMADIMDKIRELKPQTLGGVKVEYISDFRKGLREYCDGRVEKLEQAKTNVVFFGLGDTDWACVRPSGTEPKLKYYISIGEPTMEKAVAKCEAVKADIEAMVK
ncbi:MAG: phospho-sugar mutase, partial [Clostridia bacterium]|nr:phospho-sugar mutase [Clostridia bacterium]